MFARWNKNNVSKGWNNFSVTMPFTTVTKIKLSLLTKVVPIANHIICSRPNQCILNNSVQLNYKTPQIFELNGSLTKFILGLLFHFEVNLMLTGKLTFVGVVSLKLAFVLCSESNF